MYLHIGDEKEIFVGKIICILNYHAVDNSMSIIQDYDYQIFDYSYDNPQSMVLTEDFKKGKYVVYLSNISTATLKKRLSKYNRT